MCVTVDAITDVGEISDADDTVRSSDSTNAGDVRALRTTGDVRELTRNGRSSEYGGTRTIGLHCRAQPSGSDIPHERSSMDRQWYM